MSKKEEHKIKKLIQSIELDKPSENFTEKVMSKINYATSDEALKDPTLTTMLKHYGQEFPSINFADRVMAQVHKDVAVEYKPIISKKVWSVIFSLFTSFIVYVLIAEPASTNNPYISRYSTLLEKFILDFGIVLVESTQIPSILTVSIFCLSTLLLLDYFFRKRKHYQ